jgi:hypothetical protein
MIKLPLAIVLIIVALGLGVIVGMQLVTPPAPVVKVETHEVKVAGDTTIVQPTITRTVTRIVHDSTRTTDTTIVTREIVIDPPVECAGLHAEGDTVLDRELRISGMNQPVSFKDSLHLEYDFPPENRFRVMHHAVPVTAIDSLLVQAQGASTSRPWWVDFALPVMGALIPVVISLFTK